MEYIKIMPCLDTKDGRLVKGMHFTELRDVADPADKAEEYDRAGADELAVLDITATIEGRKTMLATVERVAKRISIPLTVGGGVRELADIEALVRAGASRISMNTAAVRNPAVVREAAEKYGPERIVVAIDTRKNACLPSGYEVVVNGGRTPIGQDAVEWAKEAEQLGAGMILPTSMDTDGTRAGYDIPMTRAIAEAVTVPVIASGGAGNLEHLYQAATEGKAKVLLVASIFHFGTYTVRQAKEYLKERGVAVRL